LSGVAGNARWRLRAAGLDDLADLVRLTRAFYDEDGFTTSAVDIETNFRALLDPGARAHCCIAVHDDRCVGFALTTAQLVLESGLVAELQDLYVEPDHRHGGIGAALIDDAARWARGLLARLLDVVVAPNGRDVAPLLRYYAARGFRDDGRRLISLAL
jgi:GNAT superfamily N-acetyltransferase